MQQNIFYSVYIKISSIYCVDFDIKNMCRQVTQYGTYTFLAAAIILLLSYVIEKGVNELDNMLVPCQHGTSFSQGKCRCDGTPFNGTYCSECMCAPGYCVIGGTTPFPLSEYGCRCPTGTKRFGFLCDQCNTIDRDTDCKGNCSAEYFGTRCEKRCFADLSYYNNNSICETLRENGGKCDVCHGHGTCVQGECECDENWFNDGLRKCVNTCPSTNGTVCSGHGVCKLYGGTPGCLCEIGYSGSSCEIECPGMASVGVPCNGNGRCLPDFDTKTATCDCMDKFRGEDCGIECPGDIIACNGHGTCDDIGNCTCDTNLAWSLPSCKCSDEFTCNRNGQCNSDEKCECFGNFGGDHCIECKADYYRDDCDLFCNPYSTCNGHGTCLVENNAIKCTCNLHTSKTINVDGATNVYTSYYSESSNCGECEDGYFPKQAIVDQYGMPSEFQVPCEYECEPSTCNFDAGVCNPQYGAPNTHLCDCVNPNVDESSMCTKCKDGWFPNDQCNKYCVASGTLPPECDGTKDCVSCNGHGECNLDGQCVCTGGYTGDQCQIKCTSPNGQICGGHGTCESNDIQLLMEHEFRKEGNVALFSCTCDPQDPVGADARIDWDDKLALGLVNGTLEPMPDPEYFGETCDYHCLRPPWKDSGECNGLGNCSVMTIRTPTGGFVSCNKDSDCTGSTTITQMLSIDPFWSNKKGPFCHREDDIHGCDKSADDCYEILLKQRPRKMRNEECVEGSDIITISGPPSLVLSWSECKAYADATNGLVWSGNTSWSVPPQGCYASPNTFGDDVVYFNTFASGVDCSADKYCIQLSCYDAIENEDWYSYCQNLEDKLQPPLFKDCNSVEAFCPAKTIPTVCKTMVELTDGVDVSAKLNRTYEYDKRQYPFLITAEDYRTPHASLEHDAAEQNFNFFINKWFTHTDYKLDASFCSAHSNRYPVIDYARENKQYLCNGVLQNDKNCSGVFESSPGTFYKPFEVVCPNSETEFKTYEEALQARGANCKVVEKIFNNNTADTDGKGDIDLVCKIINNKFPKCEPAKACDFNPCSAGHVCSSDGLMATCTTSGLLNSTCLSGTFVDRPSFDSYRCQITFTDTEQCPKDVSFNTNYPKYCKDNNPVVSYVESIGNSQNVSISMDKYIRFEFKATDAVLTGTRLEFEDAVTIYIRQGQIQLNEASSLQACPVTNINCHDDWAYTPGEWYTLELEINGGSVTMTRKDTGLTLTKSLLSSTPITSVATEPGQSIVQYRYISVEKDIPSPHSCTYAACNLDVNYREICSDIVRNIPYPLTLLPKHDILETCSILHINSRVVNTFSYDINKDIYSLLDWDLYCGFYDALTPLYLEVASGAPNLSLDEDECKAFADNHPAYTWIGAAEWTDRPSGCSLYTHSSAPNRIFYNKKQITYACGTSGVWECIQRNPSQYTDLETYPQCREFVDPMDGNKTCIVNALDHDWVQGCSDIDTALIPDAIEKACPNTCYNHLLSLDRDFCPERDEIFSANKVVIDTCSTDWYDYCLKDSKGTLDGKCSAVECNCDTEQYEGISGQSCEIHCPVGFDGSACAEASGMGSCRYTQLQKDRLENTIADADGNKQAFEPQFALEGECECFLSEGTRNCDIECRDCNNNTYGGEPIPDISPKTFEIYNNNAADYVINNENDPDVNICLNAPITFKRMTAGHTFRVVKESDCPDCNTGSYSSLPSSTLSGWVDIIGKLAAGSTCSSNEDCADNDCRSKCCVSTLNDPNCAVCSTSGFCEQCAAGYSWVAGQGCTANSPSSSPNPTPSGGGYRLRSSYSNTFTFSEAGTYYYVCTAHSSMVGKITVDACNTMKNNKGQIGICDTTRGACQCLPPFTAINFYNETDWRGKVIEKNERVYNDGGVTGRDLYRIRQMQGKESFIRNALQVLNVTNSRIVFTTSGTDHFVYDGQNDPDISLCQFYPYTIYHDHNEDMRIVKGEDCDNKGCSDGKWITLPSNFERDFVSTQDTTHTFFKSGTYYYMSTAAPDMVGKITVATCTGTPAYTGGEKWEKMYGRFLDNPGDFWCFDRRCSGGDVNALGSLDESSSRYNYDCNSLCPGFDNSTQLSCSKRGRCGATGQCVCDTASVITGTDDKGVKKIIQIQPGVEIINTDLTITALDRTGYRGDDCSIVCPGYDEDTKDMTTICNGHGTCDLAGECACEVGYIGDQCQFKCPSSDGTSLCNGHGTCDLAEVNIRIDTYNETSTDCELFANIAQCEGYAILNDIPVIDVAGIYEIGENEICNRITAKQCELWGTVQELYYTYTGEIIDPTKPLGCILNRDTNAIQFNKETSLANTVECGIDYNCLCQKTKPDIMYCKINEDNVLIHEMGGSEYTSTNGRWLVDSYEDKIQIKTTPGPTDYPLSRIACAKYACTLGTCTITNPESQFIVNKFEDSSTAVGDTDKPCSGENACSVLCDNDPSCTGFYAIAGYEQAPAAEAGCGTTCPNKQACQTSCTNSASCKGFVSYQVTDYSQYKECTVRYCAVYRDDGISCQFYSYRMMRHYTCGRDVMTVWQYGSDTCGNGYYLESYKKGNQFYYGSTVYTGSVTVKKMKVDRTSEWGNYGEGASSTLQPSGCVKIMQSNLVLWIWSGTGDSSSTVGRVEYDLYQTGLQPSCAADPTCLGIQEDPPGTNQWHTVSEALSIIQGSGNAYGPVPYFSDGYKCSSCDGNIFIPTEYSLIDATNICSGLARSDSNAVAFTIKVTPTNGGYFCCKSSDCRSWVEQDPDYRSYKLFDLVSAEKTRRFVKNPANLCILPEASKIEAKSQAPVLKSLRANNDLCKYIITSGTCPIAPNADDCKRYNGKYSEYNEGQPPAMSSGQCLQYANSIGATFAINLQNPGPGCVVTADKAHVRYNPGECKHPTNYHEISNGAPDMSVLDADACKAYAEYKGLTFHSDVDSLSNNNGDCATWAGNNECSSNPSYMWGNCGRECAKRGSPKGCVLRGSQMWYNTYESSRDCGYAGVNCIQRHSAPVPACECSTSNICIGTTNLVNMPDRPGGCYMDGTQYKYNTNAGSGCSATHPCVCKTDTYLDKNTNRCVSFDKEPIIDVRLYLDQGKADETTKDIDCQVNSATKITCAQCNCFDSLVYGKWAGFECETCSKGYGKSQCREVCPDYDGENSKSMCGGFGKCLFGSEINQFNGERVFQEANCVCGQDDQFQARTQNRDIVPSYPYDNPYVKYFYNEMRTNDVLYDTFDEAKEECNKFSDLSMASVGGYCHGIFTSQHGTQASPLIKFEIAMGVVGSFYKTYDAYYEKTLSASSSTAYQIKEKELSQTIVGTGAFKKCKLEIELVLSGVDTCNHFSEQSKSCDKCANGWSGKNCRLKCNKCLFQGECDQTPNEKLVSQCSCPDGSGLWGYQCCPSGFMVPNLINWNSIADDEVEQIKLVSEYDAYTNNEMDASYHCKKCPGIADMDWLQPAATHKVCSGASRGTCVSNDNRLECACKIHLPSGSTWKGRACSCHDSIPIAYSADVVRQETTDYGCLIPTSGTGVCPDSTRGGASSSYNFVPPEWFYANSKDDLRLRNADWIGFSSNANTPFQYIVDGTEQSGYDTTFYISGIYDAQRLTPFSGGIAQDIYVTSNDFHGFTGEGPCNSNTDCKGTLICYDRGGTGMGKEGYNTDRVSPTFKFCAESTDEKVGCKPVLTTTGDVWTNIKETKRNMLCTYLNIPGPECLNTNPLTNFVSTNSYWDGEKFAVARAGYFVPYTRDYNNNYIIHRQDFPCPAGKYGVENFYFEKYNNARMCVMCSHSKYQDEEGQTSCKSCPAGKNHAGVGRTSATQCQSCPVGTFPGTTPVATNSPDGIEGTYCNFCSHGEYSDDGLSCKSCPKGKFQNERYFSQECKDCVAGTYTVNAGATHGSSCTGCSGINPLVADNQYNLYEIGTSGSNDGSVSESQCEQYAKNQVCSACWGRGDYWDNRPDGCFRDSGIIYYNRRNRRITSCTAAYPCIQGSDDQLYNDGSCESCPAGKFKISSSSPCVDCRSGYYSSAYATGNRVGPCLSYYGCGSNYNYGCNACQAGKFNRKANYESNDWFSAVCGNCGQGQYSGTAATECSNCPSGKTTSYYAGTSSSSCFTCSTYQIYNGQHNCRL